MIEVGVTITGADDEVNPEILDEIGREYSDVLSVEWGILFSKSREGQPRYPTAQWREQFYGATYHRGNFYSISAHLCGKSVDTFLASYDYFENEVTMGFNAIQFNKLTEENKSQIFTFAKERGESCDVILQYNANTDVLLNGMFDDEVPNDIKILLDASGGRGTSYIETGGWPDAPEPFASRLAVGYAGGINPQNVEQTLFDLLQMHRDETEGFFWIDMESGIRTEDKFDIDKVIDVLEKARKTLAEN
jgi:phosphoribosylanthranilate isomerase